MIINLIHYISAKRRLEENEKTIKVLGGVEETPVQILAQRDMIKNEIEYYREGMWSSVKVILVVVVALLICFLILHF